MTSEFSACIPSTLTLAPPENGGGGVDGSTCSDSFPSTVRGALKLPAKEPERWPDCFCLQPPAVAISKTTSRLRVLELNKISFF